MARDPDLIGVRLSPDLLAALDAEVERQREVFPDLPINRSGVLRGIVRRALLGGSKPPTPVAPVPPDPSPAPPADDPPPAPSVAPSRPVAPPAPPVVRPSTSEPSTAGEQLVIPGASAEPNEPTAPTKPARASARSADPFAPDEEQVAARAAVLAWRAGDPAASRSRTRTNQALATACGMASESGIRGWLAGGARLRVSDLATVLAHIKATT